MLLVDLLGWWYSHGWRWLMERFFVYHTKEIAELFSMSDLLKTLGAPFRQDAVNVKGAPLGTHLQVAGENIVSRVFGFVIRSGLLLVGSLIILFNGVLATLAMIGWPLLPVAPLLALVLLISGVGA